MGKWPDNPDGDVFRSLQRNGFDFSKEYIIDFNIDFNGEVDKELINCLAKSYSADMIEDKTYENPPYIQLKIKPYVEYDFVMNMQVRLTNIASSFNGYCDSWGVMH